MPRNDSPRSTYTRLRKLLVNSFDLEELRVLCFDMGVEYEDLAGKTKTTKMQDLIQYLKRRGRLQQLIDAAAEERPNVNWPAIDTAEEEPDAKQLTEAAGSGTKPDLDVADSYRDEKTGLIMVRIPGGEFLYGEEKRLHYLPEYWISKTPVTNAHYVRFVGATGHEPPEHWKGQGPPAAIADHPVIFVSWRDAMAYGEWAGMRLPTEQEWEKAARGTDGREYPWGDTWQAGLCNTNDDGIWSPTPVGKYSPGGDSPYGCIDMAGNVLEWTNSWRDDKKTYAMLRGGSWSKGPEGYRVAYRDHSEQKDFFDDDIGFRLVSLVGANS